MISAAVLAAAPATGGTVFPTASVGGTTRAPASADATAALTTARATGGTVPSAALVRGAPAPSAVVAASAKTSTAEPATSGTAPSATSTRGAVGGRESSTGAVSSDAEAEAATSTGGTAAPVASATRAARALASAAGSAGEICGDRGASTHHFDPGTVFPLEVRYSCDERSRHNSSSGGSSSKTTPATTTHGGMQPVLEHCCDPLIWGNDAGGVRGEERRFSVWISLLTAGKNGGECSMKGDGLRAEGETMDGREQTPSGVGSGVDLEWYVDSKFASRDTNRRFVSGGVVMCAGACGSFFF